MPAAGVAKSWFEQAVSRWPDVGWPLPAYASHIADARPAHPVDLYLGGAAGHRIDPAWTTIESDLAPAAKRVLARLPLADFTTDDLWAETLVRLMADDGEASALADGRQPARLIRYRGKVKLLNYFVVVARRIAIGRQRKRRPTVSLTPTTVEGEEAPEVQQADPAAQSPDTDLADREIAAAMRQTIASAFVSLSAEQQFLITMVYRQNMKQKEAGGMLGWSEFKTTRQLQAARGRLREALECVDGVDWGPAVSAAWEGCWANAWGEVQDPPRRASD